MLITADFDDLQIIEVYINWKYSKAIILNIETYYFVFLGPHHRHFNSQSQTSSTLHKFANLYNVAVKVNSKHSINLLFWLFTWFQLFPTPGFGMIVEVVHGSESLNKADLPAAAAAAPAALSVTLGDLRAHSVYYHTV